jgi:hypothetical protein
LFRNVLEVLGRLRRWSVRLKFHVALYEV